MTQTAFLRFVAPQAVLEFEKKYRSPGFGSRSFLPVAGLSSETVTASRSDQFFASRFGPAAGPLGWPGAFVAPATGEAAGAELCWTVTGATGCALGDGVDDVQAAPTTAAVTARAMISREARTRG